MVRRIEAFCETVLWVLWASSPPGLSLDQHPAAVSHCSSSKRVPCGGWHGRGALRLLKHLSHGLQHLDLTAAVSLPVDLLRPRIFPPHLPSSAARLNYIIYKTVEDLWTPAHVRSCLACRACIQSSGNVHTSKTFNAKNRRNAAWRTKAVLCDENGP